MEPTSEYNTKGTSSLTCFRFTCDASGKPTSGANRSSGLSATEFVLDITGCSGFHL